MIKLCILLCEKVNVNNILIGDGTKIECGDKEYDLSFLKLIETGKTFYMRFGFEMDPTGHYGYYQFKNIDDLKKTRNKLIDDIRKLKIDDLINEYQNTLKILVKCITENNKSNMIILLSSPNLSEKDNFYRQKNSAAYDVQSELFTECYKMLELLQKHRRYIFYGS
jgi:hypothetical protein